MRIKEPKQKLLLTGIYIAMIGIMQALGISCVFRYFLGFTCPGCGMTRAVISALRWDFVAALEYHLMFWSVPILYLYFLFDGNLFKNKLLNRGVFTIIVVGFIINWIG